MTSNRYYLSNWILVHHVTHPNIDVDQPFPTSLSLPYVRPELSDHLNRPVKRILFNN